MKQISTKDKRKKTRRPSKLSGAETLIQALVDRGASAGSAKKGADALLDAIAGVLADGDPVVLPLGILQLQPLEFYTRQSRRTDTRAADWMTHA